MWQEENKNIDNLQVMHRKGNKTYLPNTDAFFPLFPRRVRAHFIFPSVPSAVAICICPSGQQYN